MTKVAVFCMRGLGHLQLLLPLVDALAARGCAVRVWTEAGFRPLVERAGGSFADLFAGRPLDAADATSLPVPCRFVSFAAAYADALAAEVAAFGPGLIAYDTFSVVAPVVARLLGVPYVNVFPNHAPVPARLEAELRRDPRVAVSEQCHAAVRRLRDAYGMRDASPFSYVAAVSPHLNLYGEPPEYLDAADRAALEPVAFFGSLAPELRGAGQGAVFPRERRGLWLYVALGTVVWWYFAARARAALEAVAEACAELEIDAVIALGGHALDPAARAAIERPNVTLLDFADQWQALVEADLFLTHHGLNSTHEAVFHRVPMLSYPFFGDQPALARRCQELGLALPLVRGAGEVPDAGAVREALARVAAGRAAIAARLEAARAWELRTIAERPALVERVLALAHRA